MNQDPAEQLALARYAAIGPAVGQGLSDRERRERLREQAQLDHLWPDGRWRQFTLRTLERWLGRYTELRLEGLRRQPRHDRGSVRQHVELMEEAAQLRRELPARSADQIARIMKLRHDVWVPPRSIRRQLTRQGLRRRDLEPDGPREVFGRFEADRPNELWVADFLDGPPLPYPPQPNSRRKTHILAFLDDHSRLVVGARWVLREDARTAQIVFRQALIERGRPEGLYVDLGGAFISAALRRSCAVLGVRLIHARRGRPQGRGKVERFLGTVERQFFSEARLEPINTLFELNDRFWPWLQLEYHRNQHSETHQAPLERWLQHGTPAGLLPGQLFEAFRWSEPRLVTKTAEISMPGNRYKVNPALAGRRVEIRFEPEDLSRVEVWYEGLSYGLAEPVKITRHAHAKLGPPAPTGDASPSAPLSSSSYLAQLQQRYERETFAELDYRPATQKEQP